MIQLSSEAQKLWDEFGWAFEAHIDASWELGNHEEVRQTRRSAATRYLTASRHLYEYIAELEVAAARRAPRPA